MKVIKILIDEIENPGCSNGNYPGYVAVFDSGEEYSGTTCRCGCGCSGQDRLPSVGVEFHTFDEFYSYIKDVE